MSLFRSDFPSLGCLLLVAGCSVFVDVNAPPPGGGKASVGGAVPGGVDESQSSGLTFGERARFAFENLGEVELGLCYRSAGTNARLLQFLASRFSLGHVITLRQHVQPVEQKIAQELGGTITHLPMSPDRPPEPGQILEMIRVTQRARSEGRSVLIHCRRGADRTSMMVAIWRMLFQGSVDREVLTGETWYYGHNRFAHPTVHRVMRRFRPELFLPFVGNPSLLDDNEAIETLERQYFQGQPLLSGRKGTTRGKLTAGVGKVALASGIEPPIPMATYGPMPGMARGARDPVFARAIVFDNGATRFALVSCDLMIMDLRVRQLVLQATRSRGLELDDILVAATHTHTSIGGYVEHWLAEFYIMGSFRADVRSHLVGRIVDAISLAVEDRRPAKLGVGRTSVRGFSRNRRLGATVDTEVGIIKVEESAGAPLALLVNFAGHPVLDPADGLLSPDYPGRLSQSLDDRYGFGLFLQGALGDLNASPGGGEDSWRSAGLAARTAAGIFEAVAAATPSIETHEEVELGSLTALIDIPPVNINVIPDLLFPLDWLVGWAAQWPREAPMQICRVGDAAIIGCSTELGVRIGRRIKRRSPAPYPFVVSHANSYTGYAVTQVLHPRSKVDATSAMANNGSRYGRVIEEAAVDLLEAQYGTRLDRGAPLLSPAARQELERRAEELPEPEREGAEATAVATERRELLIDADPTVPQTRRFGGRSDSVVSDSISDVARLSFFYRYLDGARGGQGVRGRVRDAMTRLRVRLPVDIRLEGRFGHRRSSFDSGGRATDEGATDPVLGFERPFEVARDDNTGTALRLIPRVGLSAPTGDREPMVPFRFAVSNGVWRPEVGAGLELTWETARVLTIDTRWLTSTEQRDGRRPGDQLGFNVGFRERHGVASLSLDWGTDLYWPDERRGRRQRVDVGAFSFQMDIRPGITLHLADHVEFQTTGIFPVAQSGSGAGQGKGVVVGLQGSF